MKYKKDKCLFIYVAFLIAVCAGCLAGCNQRPLQANNLQATASDNDLKRLNKLYEMYLNGDTEQARKSLLDVISVLPSCSFQNKDGIPICYWLTYSRLYCLEKNAGNPEAAASYFEQAKHWYKTRLLISQRHRLLFSLRRKIALMAGCLGF